MIKTLLGKLFGNKSKEEPNTINVNVNNIHQLCLNTFTELLELHIKDSSNINYVTTIAITHETFEEFINYVKIWINLTKENKAVSRNLLGFGSIELSLDDFFITKDKTYLNTDTAFKTFCEVMILYCNTFLSVSSDASNASYNKRVSSNLTAQFYNVGKALLANR